MTETLSETASRRWWGIRKIQIDNGRMYVTLLILAVLVGFAWGSLSQSAFDNTAGEDWYSGFWQNFSTEMIGAIITFLLFELVLGTRQRADDRKETKRRDEQLQNFLNELNKRTEEQNRKALQTNAIARLQLAEKANDKEQRDIILKEMKKNNLLQGANLEQRNLTGADLRGSDFSNARLVGANLSNALLTETNMSGVRFRFTNLSGADMRGVNLSGLHFAGTNLSQTDLRGANLSGASLRQVNLVNAEMLRADLSGASLIGSNVFGSNLMGAYLSGADLRGCNLCGVDLRGADLKDVQVNEDTRLPDGDRWKKINELGRFTDQEHPQYEVTLARINAHRLDQGQQLLVIGEHSDYEYPLPGERLDVETMRERVNARRAELGLEPLQ